VLMGVGWKWMLQNSCNMCTFP
jgi:hypothetical protein